MNDHNDFAYVILVKTVAHIHIPSDQIKIINVNKTCTHSLI